MPINTKHYDLSCFSSGDVYLSSLDKKRFTIIDNQLSFLSSVVGDGVIDGWLIKQAVGQTITVEHGFGVIEGFATSTLGDINVDLPDDDKFYIYIRRKPEINSDISSMSDVASLLNYVDTALPHWSGSANLRATDTSYNNIDLSWNACVDLDISHYSIYRRIQGESSFIKIGESVTTSYVDTDIIQNTTYEYIVYATDVNENTSLPTEQVAIQSEHDDRIPGDPLNVEVINGHETMQVVWDSGGFLSQRYKVLAVPIDSVGVETGEADEYDVTDLSLIITHLANGQQYKITVKSVSYSGETSNGVIVIGQPSFSYGSKEFTSFSIDDIDVDDSLNLKLTLLWDLASDEYIPDPSYYYITISAGNQDSEASYYSGFLSADETGTIEKMGAIITQYTLSNGDTITIHEETTYTIKIESVDADGLRSVPYIVRYRTRKFGSPDPVTNLEIEGSFTKISRNLKISWNNPQTAFSYNKITLIRKPQDHLQDPGEWIHILDGQNVGQAETFTAQSEQIENYSTYYVVVTPVDSYGNEGEQSERSFSLAVNFANTFMIDGISIQDVRPPAPTDVSSLSGNDQVTLYWNEAKSDYVASYRVYRADVKSSGIQPDDFIQVESVSAGTLKFNDYDVENGKQYFYIVTSVDIFDQESPNPSDGYISYAFATGEPRSHSYLNKPSSLDLAVDSENPNNIIITWQNDDDYFDGYIIYRASNNRGAMVRVGSVGPFETTFTDIGALTENGNYYYRIRKFRDEGEIIVTRTEIAPLGCLFLGSALVSSQSVTVYPLRYNIKMMLDPIKDEVARQLSVPTHLYYNKGDDRRIRLNDYIVVDDWITDDFQSYSTYNDIRSTGNYIAYINGIQSGFANYIDTTTGVLSFEEPIFKRELPTDNGPSVSVIFTDIGEVQGILPSEHIGTVLAAKVTKGKVQLDRLNKIDHFGRYKEPCSPLRYMPTRNNAYVFSADTPIGTTFYDILKTVDGNLLAASSDGLQMTVADDSSRWKTIYVTDIPFTRVYYSEVNDLYFAISGGSVFYSKKLVDWVLIPGTSAATVIRDICEGNGTLYITADSGLYYLDPSTYTRFTWNQSTAVNPVNNSLYACCYDSTGLIVASESGISRSIDGGNSWLKLTEFDIKVPVHAIVSDNETYFLISENEIWRKRVTDSECAAIATLPFSCRKAVIFGDVLYVTTDSGLYCSDTGLLTNDVVKFKIAFLQLQRNSILPPVFGLRVFNNRMWLGMDDRIYSVTSQRSLYLHADIPGICPTLYVNGINRSVGAYYSTSGKILFDIASRPQDKIEIVREYTTFQLLNGGWVDSKYDAEITLVINDTDQPPPSKVKNDASSVAAATRQIIIPIFNARNSNFSEASKWLKKIVQIQDTIETDNMLYPTMAIEAQRVTDLYNAINIFKANIYEELQSDVKTPAMGGRSTTTSQINFDFDAVNGNITIYDGVTKYTRVAVSIKNAGLTGTGTLTHKQIEDVIDSVDSGLPASLSCAQQSNIIKAGLFNQMLNPFAQEQAGLTYQSVLRNACDSWYDKLSSTIDYCLMLEQKPPSLRGRLHGIFSIEYPADILYLPTQHEIWVCGSGGIISIGINGYECKRICQSEFYFYNMHLDRGIVYAIAEDGLYIIDPSTKVVTKNVDIPMKSGFTSVLQYGDTTYLATNDGLYARRPFELEWRQILNVNKAFVRSTGNLTFCVGQDPNDDNTSVVYYSHQGVVWNRANQFTDYIITGVSQRYDNIYYATNKGLLIEDLSKLYQEGASTFIEPVDLDDNEEPDEFIINAVDANDNAVVAARSSGTFYTLSGTEIISSGQCTLETIHKVKVVPGADPSHWAFWFFCNNLVEIVEFDHNSEIKRSVIHLSTGKNLT